MQFNCKGTPLLNQILDGAESKVEPLAWWTDRHGHIHSYWYGSGKPFPVFERAESKETEPHEDWREKIGCYCGPSNVCGLPEGPSHLTLYLGLSPTKNQQLLLHIRGHNS